MEPPVSPTPPSFSLLALSPLQSTISGPVTDTVWIAFIALRGRSLVLVLLRDFDPFKLLNSGPRLGCREPSGLEAFIASDEAIESSRLLPALAKTIGADHAARAIPAW